MSTIKLFTHHSRYDAFGENIGGTGAVANKYLFAGEQYDSNLGDYYLRARYYNSEVGRFIRKDDYEGTPEVPSSLHRYAYTENDPINHTDPSGYSRRVGSLGNYVHEYIGGEFVLQKPNFQTGQGRRYDSAFRRYTINKVLAELGRNTPGVIGNDNRPDLVDFDERVLYEIKPQGYEEEGKEDLDRYLKLINLQLQPGDRKWREGTAREYVPPRRIVAPPAKVIRIDSPQNGLILYEQENDYTDNFLVTVEILAITAALLYALKDALSRRTAVAGL